MKKLLVIFGTIFLLSMTGLNGCLTKKPIVEGTGTIVYNDFEGGFYGIIADFNISGYPLRNLDPMNLPQEFKEEGLHIWFKVRLRPDLVSVHMWGILVEIIEINKI